MSENQQSNYVEKLIELITQWDSLTKEKFVKFQKTLKLFPELFEYTKKP